MSDITLTIPLAAYGNVATAAALEGVDVSTYVKSHILTARHLPPVALPGTPAVPTTPNPAANHEQ